MQGTLVWSPVRELRAHMPWAANPCMLQLLVPQTLAHTPQLESPCTATREATCYIREPLYHSEDLAQLELNK